MKATGIIRKPDALGRFVIPKELRRVLDIKREQEMEIYMEGHTIVISKYQHKCALCNSGDELTEFSGKLLCHDCVSRIKQVS
ncbi:MAG: AbrB/MazE/SpoVT family DNA-binding domain-containing protein [Defluviitaleaceae bacterium]|nr:AbrB/MazE/SpoVT family DNA-binding domain-containing protein [Defluviitaleaceae bacterium]